MIDGAATGLYPMYGRERVEQDIHRGHVEAWQQARLQYEQSTCPEVVEANRQNENRLSQRAKQIGSFIEIPRGLGAEAPYRLPGPFIQVEAALSRLAALEQLSGSLDNSPGLVVILTEDEDCGYTLRHLVSADNLRQGLQEVFARLDGVPSDGRAAVHLERLGLNNCVGQMSQTSRIARNIFGRFTVGQPVVAFLPDSAEMLETLGTPRAPVSEQDLRERLQALPAQVFEESYFHLVRFTDGRSLLEAGPAFPASPNTMDYRFANR